MCSVLELLMHNGHKRLYFFMYTPLSCASVEEETSLQHEEVTPNRDGFQVISIAKKRVSSFTADCPVSILLHLLSPTKRNAKGAHWGSLTRRHGGEANQPPTDCLPPPRLTTVWPPHYLCPCCLHFPLLKNGMEVPNLQSYVNITNKIIWSWIKLQP